MAQRFGDERCTAAILEYLRATEAGLECGRRLMGEEDYGKQGTGDDSDAAEDSDEAEEDEEALSEGWGSHDEGGLGSVCGLAGTGGKGTVPKRGRGVEARVRFNEFPLYFSRGVPSEAASVGYSRKAVKCMYICHGRKAAV
jgi:hypothetical protein